MAGQAAARAIDPLADVVAFIDDTYFIGLPEAAAAGHKAYQSNLWEEIKVKENNESRICILGRGVEVAGLPEDIAECVVSCLPCVGAQLDCARADRVPAIAPAADVVFHVSEGPPSSSGEGESWCRLPRARRPAPGLTPG